MNRTNNIHLSYQWTRHFEKGTYFYLLIISFFFETTKLLSQLEKHKYSKLRHIEAVDGLWDYGAAMLRSDDSLIERMADGIDTVSVLNCHFDTFTLFIKSCKDHPFGLSSSYLPSNF